PLPRALGLRASIAAIMTGLPSAFAVSSRAAPSGLRWETSPAPLMSFALTFFQRVSFRALPQPLELTADPGDAVTESGPQWSLLVAHGDDLTGRQGLDDHRRPLRLLHRQGEGLGFGLEQDVIQHAVAGSLKG